MADEKNPRFGRLPGGDPLEKAAQAAEETRSAGSGAVGSVADAADAAASTGGGATGPTGATSATWNEGPGSATPAGVSSTGGRAAEGVVGGPSATRSGSQTRHHKVELEKRSMPWWLAAPAVAGLAGLAAWQMIGVRHRSEGELRAKAEGALKAKYPGASLRFHGRDAIVSGLSAADQAAAHNLIRDLPGVRNVIEGVHAAPPTTAAPAVTATEPAAATAAAPPTSKPTVAPVTKPAPAPTKPAPTTAKPTAAPTTANATTEPTTAAPSTTSAPATTAPATATTAPPTTAVPTTAVSSDSAGPATAVVAGDAVTLGFDRDSCDVNEVGTASLDGVAAYLTQNPDAHASISGYTDSTGTRLANLAISACRADAVRSALVDRGIDRDRLSARGFGERRPVASNATGSGRDANRRVEIAYSGGRQIQYTG